MAKEEIRKKADGDVNIVGIWISAQSFVDENQRLIFGALVSGGDRWWFCLQ